MKIIPKHVPGTVVISARVTREVSAEIDIARGSLGRAQWLSTLIHAELARTTRTSQDGQPPAAGHTWGLDVATRVRDYQIQRRYQCTGCETISDWIYPADKLAHSAVTHSADPVVMDRPNPAQKAGRA